MTLQVTFTGGTTSPFRIFDTTQGIELRARFHTRAQAEAWIDARENPPMPTLEQRVRTILHPGTMHGRATAHLITPEILARMVKMGRPDAGHNN